MDHKRIKPTFRGLLFSAPSVDAHSTAQATKHTVCTHIQLTTATQQTVPSRTFNCPQPHNTPSVHAHSTVTTTQHTVCARTFNCPQLNNTPSVHANYTAHSHTTHRLCTHIQLPTAKQHIVCAHTFNCPQLNNTPSVHALSTAHS